jgi:preprotein translocase subunit SecD
VVSSPRIMGPIVGSSLVISGSFTTSEVADLARRLSNGHAHVEINLAAE